MESAELELQLASTMAFIMADAEYITLIRTTKEEDGAGGFIFNGPYPLAEQLVRLIPQTDRVQEVNGSDGRAAFPEYVIMMDPEADLQRYDTFEWRGVTWEVAQIHTKPEYELKGDVIRK